MAANLHCALQPSIVAIHFEIYLLRNQNRPPIALADFISDLKFIILDDNVIGRDITQIISSLELDTEGYIVSQDNSVFANYLTEIIEIISASLPVRGFFDEAVNFGANFKATMIDALGTAIMDDLELKRQSIVVTQEFIADEEEKQYTFYDENEEFSDGDSTEVGVPLIELLYGSDLSEEIMELYLTGQTYNKKKLSLPKFIQNYFVKFGDVIPEFQKFYVTKFYNHLINTKAGEAAVREELHDVFLELKAEMVEIAKNIGNKTDLDLRSSGEQLRHAYYAAVILKEFDNVKSYFLKGLKTEAGVSVTKDGKIRKGFGFDGKWVGLDQAREFIKMHIYTTPRLIKQKDGSYLQDTQFPYLTEVEVVNSFDLINSFDHTTSRRFVASMKKWLETTPSTGSNIKMIPVIESLYNRFFKDGTYNILVNNKLETHLSLRSIAEQQVGVNSENNNIITAQNIMTAIHVFMTSQQNMEHIIVTNGEVIVTRTSNTQVSSIIKDDIALNIMKPVLSRTKTSVAGEVNENILKHINFNPENGTLILDGLPIKFTLVTNKGAGKLIQVTDSESLIKLNDKKNVSRLMQLLGLPNYITSSTGKFIDQYNSLYQKDYSIGQMIANLAYAIAINNNVLVSKMQSGETSYFVTQDISKDPSELTYPLANTIPKFLEFIAEAAELSEGITAKKVKLNLNNDPTAIIAPKSRLHTTKALITKIKDLLDDYAVSNEERSWSVHDGNLLINGGKNGRATISLVRPVTKDGLTKYHQKRPNGKLTAREQFKYAIEYLFFNHAAKNNLSQAIFQPCVQADKSTVEALIIQRDNGKEMISKDRKSMRQELLDSQMKYHENLARQLTTSWLEFFNSNKQLKIDTKALNEFKSAINRKKWINALDSLDQILIKSNIPIALANESNLVKELMYKEQSSGNLMIPLTLYKMIKIFENSTSAGKFLDRQLLVFKRALKDNGFNHDILDYQTKQDLRTRNFSFNTLIESYFWQSNIVTNSFVPVTMGSQYQYGKDFDNSLFQDSKTRNELQKQIIAAKFGREADPEATMANNQKRNLVEQQLENDLNLKRLAVSLSTMYVAQAKRASSLGASFQWPKLLEYDEQGKQLGLTTRSALIEDPEKETINLLGSMKLATEEIYNAAQFAHPLYFLRLNHSLGNDQNQYSTFGGQQHDGQYQDTHGTIKDISIEIEPDGILRFQKKATFNMFSNEILKNLGNTTLYRLFKKMNTAISFNDGKGIILTKNIEDKWTVKEGKQESNDVLVMHMHDLWLHHGGIDNNNAWTEILELIALHPVTMREAYIEKVGFLSGEKTGNRAINKANIWSDEAKDTALLFTNFSNESHGVILSSDHNPDTTADYSARPEFSEDDNSEVSIMTQAISAIVFQGETLVEAGNIFSAIQSLSQLQLTLIKKEVNNHAYTILEQLFTDQDTELQRLLTKEQNRQLGLATSNTIISEEEIAHYESIIKSLKEKGLDIRAKGMRLFVQQIVDKDAHQREDFGIVTELSGMLEAPLDALQLNNITQSSVMGKLTRDTVKVKFRGGQYVVSASEDFIKLYSLPTGETVTRLVYQKSKLVKEQVVENSRDLADFDLVWVDKATKPITFNELMKNNGFNIDEVNQKYFNGANRISAKLPVDNGRSLQWMNYFTINPDTGKKQMITDFDHPLTGSIFEELQQLKDQAAKGQDVDLVKRDQLQTKLHAALASTELEWNTQDAEFFMPMLHQSAYNLEEGDSIFGAPDSIMGDDSDLLKQRNAMIKFFKGRIVKTGDQQRNKLVGNILRQVLIVDAFKEIDTTFGNFSTNDLKALENHYGDLLVNRASEFSTLELSALSVIHKLISEKVNLYVNELKNKGTDAIGSRDIDVLNILIQDSKSVFRNTVDRKKYNLNSKFKELKATSFDALVQLKDHYSSLSNNISISPNELKYINAHIKKINELILFYNKSKNNTPVTQVQLAALNSFIRSNKNNYISELAEAQADNFPKTLEFLVGRIPSQGKQSFVAGKVAGFITSQRNSMFGPVEMLTVTGADHDIDKGNIKAYGVDKYGVLYNFQYFNPDLEKDKILNEEDFKVIVAYRIAAMNTKLASSNMSRDSIRKQLHNFEKTQLEYFAEATKNYILDNMLKVIRHPKNAIEASMPVSMSELRSRVDKFGKSLYNEDLPEDNMFDYTDDDVERNDEVTYLDDSSVIFSIYNPSSIPILEIINLTGKDAISVYANSIKVYSALYNAWTQAIENNEGEYIQFNNDLIQVMEDNPLIQQYYNVLFKDKLGDLDPNALSIFSSETYQNELGDVVQSPIIIKSVTGIANTNKFKNKELLEEVRKLKLQFLQNPELEAAMSDDIVAMFEKGDNIVLEQQGWELLSQFLSAATDNAKELILGRINATSVTNGVIATGIILGFDIKSILDIFTSHEVKSIVQTVENSRDSTHRESPKNFKKATEDYLRKKYGQGYDELIDELSMYAENVKLATDKISINQQTSQRLQIDQITKFNITDLDDIEINYLEGHGGATSKFEFGQVIEHKVGKATPEEVTRIKLLVKKEVSIDDYDKFASVLRLFDNADMVVTNSITSQNEFKELIRNYAKENPNKNVYSIRNNDWKKINSRGEEEEVMGAVFNKNVAYFGKYGNLNAKNLWELSADTRNLLFSQEKYFGAIDSNVTIYEQQKTNESLKFSYAFEEFLTSKPRQLLTLIKISEELRALTSILSINQGLPNNAFGNYQFRSSIENFINKKLGSKVFDINKFVDSITNDGSYHKLLIEKYNEVKSGVNILYILSKNKQYLGYLEARMYGDELINSVSFTNKLLNATVDRLSTLSTTQVDETVYNSIRNFVYGLGIEKYLKSRNSNLTLSGQSFDLSNNIERADFMRKMPFLVDDFKNDWPELQNNLFIQKLKKGNLMDNRIKEGLITLEVPSLINTHEITRAALQTELLQLKNNTNYKELHEALFIYTLILNKGGRNKESFASLFEKDTFINYTNFLTDIQKNPVKVEKFQKEILVEFSPEAILLANPMMIPVISTENKTLRRFLAEDIDAALEAYAEDAELDGQKLSLAPAIYRSRETGELFYRSPDPSFKNRHIVISPIIPIKAIPYTLQGITPLQMAGYQLGKTVFIDSNENKANVLFYDEKKQLYVLDNNEQISADNLRILNEDMYFDSFNFGKSTDRLAKKLSSMDAARIDRPSEAVSAEIIKGRGQYLPLDFRVLAEDLDESGQFLKVTWKLYDGKQTVYVKLKYLGVPSVVPYQIRSKLVRGDKYFKGYKAIMESKNNNTVPLAEIVFVTPIVGFDDKFDILRPDLKRAISPQQFGHIMKKLASHAITSNKELRKLLPEVGSTALLPVYRSNKTPIFFEVTNQGPISTFKTSRNINKDNLSVLYKMFGYTKSPTNDDNFVKELNSGTAIVYQFKPHNGRARSINSTAELDSYRSNTKLNENIDLSNAHITIIGTQTEYDRERIEYFEKKGLAARKVTLYDNENLSSKGDKLYQKATEDMQVMKSRNEDPSENKKIANAIAIADAIYMMIPVSNVSNKEMGFGQSVELKVSNEQRALISMIRRKQNLKTDEDLKNYIDEELIRNKAYLDEAGKYKYENAGEFLRAINFIALNIGAKSYFPSEYKTKTSQNRHAMALQIAKAAASQGTPLYVYNTERYYWEVYNSNSGVFVPTSIPVLSNNPLLIGDPTAKDAIAKRGFEGLLLKKAYSNLQSIEGLSKPSDISSITMLSKNPINLDINMVAEQGDSVLNNITTGRIVTEENFIEGKFVEEYFDDNSEEAKTRPIRRLYIEDSKGEPLYRDSFIEWDSDTVVSQLADGSITIEGTINGYPQFFVVMSDELSNQYGDFENDSDSIRLDFSFKVGEKYYYFEKVFKTTAESFERRDHLIEERLKLNQLFDTASDYFRSEILPLYQQVRYNSIFNNEYYLAYGNSYRAFMLFLTNSSEENVDPNQPIEIESLIEKHDNYLKLQAVGYAYRNELEKKYDKALEVKNFSGNFFDNPGENDVLVYLSDSNNQHLHSIAGIAKTPYGKEVWAISGKSYHTDENGEVKSFSIGVVDIDNNILAIGKIYTSIERLIKMANTNSKKQFFVQLPQSVEGKVYGELTGVQLAKIFVQQLNKFGVPTNLQFSESFAELVTEIGRGVDPRKINRTLPFRFTRDLFDQAYDVTSTYDPYFTKWDDKNTIADIWNERRGYPGKSINAPANKNSMLHGEILYEAYKDLWRLWAIKNPASFNKLATLVGDKAIYDSRVPLDQDGFSTGEVLRDLLTEKFVDNSWINLPTAVVDATLVNEQSYLPIPLNNDIPFNTDGAALVVIKDKTYIARLIYRKIDFDYGKIYDNEAAQFGLDLTTELLPQIFERYPFILKDKSYSVVSLQETNATIKHADRVQPGLFLEQLLQAKIELDEHQTLAASRANITYGFDFRRRITDADTGYVVGTNWIDDIKGTIGFGIFNDSIKSSDVVWMYGTKISDNVSAEHVQRMFEALQPFVDRVASAGADILVGLNSGIDEQIRAYVMSKYSAYQETEEGLTAKNIKVDVRTAEIIMYKTSSRLPIRFNQNNSFNRELDHTGAHGTVLFTERNAAIGEGQTGDFRVAIPQTKIASWKNSIMDGGLKLTAHLREIADIEEENDFSKTREAFLVREQMFANRFLQLATMTELGLNFPHTSLSAFDQFVSDLEKSHPEFRHNYVVARNKVFKDGSFDVSDVAKLAMIRNRYIANNYLEDLNPILSHKKYSETNGYKLIAGERTAMDTSSGYFELMTTNKLSEQELKLISEAKNVSNRDIYNFLMTFGPYRHTAGGKGRLNGASVNQYFMKNDILAFKEGETIIVLDNSKIKPLKRSTGNFDISFERKVPLSKGADKFVKMHSAGSYTYRYLVRNGLISFNDEGDRFTITLDKVQSYDTTREGVNSAIRDLKFVILKNYLESIDGINFNDSFLASEIKEMRWNSSLTNLLSNHIQYGKALKSDYFKQLFSRKPVGILEVNKGKLVSFSNYELDNKKVFVVKDSTGDWYAQSQTGELYKLGDRAWELVPNIDNSPVDMNFKTQNKIASPRGINMTYNQLRTISQVLLTGEFTVSETIFEGAINDSIIEAKDEDGNVWQWNEFGTRGWIEVVAGARKATEIDAFQLETNFIPGQVIMNLYNPLGYIQLYNGIAGPDGTTVKDDKGVYKYVEELGWVLESSTGGFSNPDIKFMKGSLSLSQAEWGEKALVSKRVSPELLRKMTEFLNNKLGTNIEILSSEDIELKYGKVFSNKAAFVTPNGDIVINQDLATADSALHEVIGHVYIDYLKINKPEIFRRIIDLSLEHPLASKIARLYPELQGDALGEEVFASLFGLVNQELLETEVTKSILEESKEESIWKSIKNSIKGFRNWFNSLFKDMFGITDTEFEIDTSMSLMDIINQLGSEVVFGDGSFFSTVNSNTQSTMNGLLNNFTEEEIFSKLRVMGLIKTICI